jgi:60 kDa SS-A/Ro ribonucleoprotein
MAIQTLFSSYRGPMIQNTDALNNEGAPAYALSAKQALAQFAATGCFGRTFYASELNQLDRTLELCQSVDPEFVAKVAIHARRNSYMKDMPALLCAWLSTRAPRLHEVVFGEVVDSMKMLRNYVQILRSGVVGRKSLGTAPKRLVRTWLASKDEETIFRSSTGANPSVADILKMVHPKPSNERRNAFYGYMIGHRVDHSVLPGLVTSFERFKAGEAVDVPDLPMTLLTSLPLSRRDWAAIARRAPWQTVRMNLNTFARQGAFEEAGVAEHVAGLLRDRDEIRQARVFPYQLLAAYRNCSADIPANVREALQDALEIAIHNVPAVRGKVYVCPDVSGSMRSPITGHRRGATTAVQCVDVAALVASAILSKNPSAEVLPFETDIVRVELNPRDSVMTNSAKLAAVGGGGTNCSAPLRLLNQRKAKGDLIMLISDNESWVDAGRGRGTGLMQEWGKFRQRNMDARLVCLDVQPYATTQAVEREDILNIGGFSDGVFETIAAFAAAKLDADHWVSEIEKITV